MKNYAEFQSELAANPLADAVIEGTGGLRKVRMSVDEKRTLRRLNERW